MIILLEFDTKLAAKKWINDYQRGGGPRQLKIRKINNGKWAVVDMEEMGNEATTTT